MYTNQNLCYMDPKMVSGLSVFDENVIAISKNIRKKHISDFFLSAFLLKKPLKDEKHSFINK